MKKTQNISIASLPVIIDDDAYQLLKKYLDNISTKFKDDDLSELQKDVEVRILELLYEQKWKDSNSISHQQVSKIIEQIGDIELDDQDNEAGRKTKSSEKKKLFRDEKNGQFFGICQGLGEYFGIDPVWLRLLFIIMAFITSGAFVFIYILASFIIPDIKTEFDRAQLRGKSQDVNSIFNSLKTDNYTERFLINFNLWMGKSAKLIKRLIILTAKLTLQIIRSVSLGLAIFSLFGLMTFIWSNPYQEELNIFLTPLKLSEKIGFSLINLSFITLLVLLFLSLSKILNKNKLKYKNVSLIPAYITVMVIIIAQVPPAFIWGRSFFGRNQNWETMNQRYFTKVQYQKELQQPKLNIEANGKFIYSIEFSDDDKFYLETVTYSSLKDYFKLETEDPKEAKLTSPPYYSKVLQADSLVCLTCVQAKLRLDQKSFAGLIKLRIPRKLKTIHITNNANDFANNTEFIVNPEVLDSGVLSEIINTNSESDYNLGSSFTIINQKTNEIVYPEFNRNY